MKHFFKSERGYALVLTLMFMPVFIGISLLVIDIGRANNAQGDHQAAADALALAGARELDGRTDAITRAKAAMATLDNSVSFLGTDPTNPSIDLIYEDAPGNTFTVIFLDDIPASDDDPIDQAWVDDHATGDPAAADYVYVYSRSSDLRPFFFNPATQTRNDIPISARAVATYTNATCELTPLFICIPAPYTNRAQLEAAFASGALYGRLNELRVQNGTTPGNFGFLQIDAPGANALAPYLAGKRYPNCKQDDSTVDTEPGAKTSVLDAFNTRFDIYDKNGDYSKGGEYSPASMVRKGYVGKTCPLSAPKNQTEWLSAITYSDDVAIPVGDPRYASSPSKYTWNFSSSVTIPNPYDKKGGTISYPAYWSSIYSKTLTKTDYEDIITHPAIKSILATQASPPYITPSRYDVYKYEVEQMAANSLAPKNGLAENGNPVCYNGTSTFPNSEERRTLYVAMVDCDANDVSGRSEDVPVEVYAKVFLVRPVDKGGQSPIVIELSDISGPKGNGSVDLFLRQEAYLVR
jgi:hypothetical protein